MNPSPAAREVWRGLRCTRITLPHGDSVRVSDFGAQVLSWNARGQERMFLSDRAVLDGSAAIRGGVPVCFPQFNQRGPLPKHGLARRTTWDWLGAEVQGHAVTTRWQWAAAAPLHPDFPHALQAELAVTLLPDTLQITLSATNTGSTALACRRHSSIISGDGAGCAARYACRWARCLSSHARCSSTKRVMSASDARRGARTSAAPSRVTSSAMVRRRERMTV